MGFVRIGEKRLILSFRQLRFVRALFPHINKLWGISMTISDNFDPLLTAKESAKTLQCSLPTFWRWVAAGSVPKPVKLGALSRWPQSEILAVIEKAKAARDNDHAA
jgi:predicted DNA-binding transcriptional regulator AlpA